MINIGDLGFQEIGKVVCYYSPDTGAQEYGVIKFWSPEWIFVNYFLRVEDSGGGYVKGVSERCGETAEATNAAHLVFVFPWQIPQIRSKK